MKAFNRFFLLKHNLMFSSTNTSVREKHFLVPRRKVTKNGLLDIDASTMTDNLLLFTAQQARIEASRRSPGNRLMRFLLRR